MSLNEIITIIALIVGPVLAVLISIWRDSRAEKDRAKLQLFLTMMANRSRMPPPVAWTDALNVLDVIFDDEKEVLAKWRSFFECVNSSPVDPGQYATRKLAMLSAMATALGYNELEEHDIDKFYSPTAQEEQNKTSQDIQHELLDLLRSINIGVQSARGEKAVSVHLSAPALKEEALK